MQEIVRRPQNVITFERSTGGEINPFTGPDSATSREAGSVREAGSKIAKSAEASHSLFGAKAATISEILTVADECEDENWDGEGAKAIKDCVAGRAVALIRALPMGTPMPEVAPDRDGRMSLDWILTRYSFLSVSIGSTDRLPYAWVDGGESGHGVARFDGSKVPPRIFQGIHSITNRGHATLRAA